MSKSLEKIEALKLRREGNSIKDIAKRLSVSRSIVSIWCRDVTLSKEQSENLHLKSIKAGNKGRLIGAEKNKKRRLDEIAAFNNKAVIELGQLSKRDLIILASALFWAEGAKTGSRFLFVNSDPDMVRLMYRFVTKVMEVPSNKVFLTVQINKVHETRINKVIKFWSTLLDLPLKQFTKPYYIAVVPKKHYENHEQYYGIARLGVRGGASLQYRILGYINALKLEK